MKHRILTVFAGLSVLAFTNCTDLEEETILEVIRILKEEFED